MKKSVTVAASCILYAVVFLLISAFFLTDRQAHKRRRQESHILAEEIYNGVMAALAEPLAVAKVMANDSFLVDLLEKEEQRSEDENVSLLCNYLSAIKSPFRYAYACVISDASHRYYRNDGLLKVISPGTDAGDSWYSYFCAGDRRYTGTVWLNTEAYEESTIFLNYPIRSGDRLLGVVSTGVYLTDILTLLSDYEERYHIRICMTDASGLVILDSIMENIDAASLAHVVLSEDSEQEDFRYLQCGTDGCLAVKWLPEYKWYFVLHNQPAFVSIFADHWFYLFALLVLVLAQLVLFLFRRRFHGPRVAYVEQSAHVDALTGLRNRNFFKDMYGERGVFNTTRYECLAVFDIDFFKEANDNMNGDIALVSVVNHMRSLLSDRGMVLRWGGDEFLVLFELSLDSAYTLCRQFCKNVAADGFVTVSVGLTEVRLSDTIKKNYYRAARNCYQVKEMGGNGVIKN